MFIVHSKTDLEASLGLITVGVEEN